MGACGEGSGRVARIPIVAIRPSGWGDLEAAAELLGEQNRAAGGEGGGPHTGRLRSDRGVGGFAGDEETVHRLLDKAYGAWDPLTCRWHTRTGSTG